ncbi:MAG: lipid A biosynthesis acyltransferase [Burkholderiaceae bacterium]|nr:lipid A biosynthesis acyltransferase [Burkholderiaceae bacterium]
MDLWAAGLGIALINRTARWSASGRRQLARLLGDLGWSAVASRRRVTLANLRACFPEASETERRAMGRRVFRNLTRATIDHSVLWKGSKEQIEHLVRVDGLERLLDPAKRPLIMLAPHFVGLDAGAVRLSIDIAAVSIYAQQSNPVWDRWLAYGRSRFRPQRLIARRGSDLRAVVRAMRDGVPFYYLPDIDGGASNSIFAPFMGVPTATLPMVSRLARMVGARVVMTVTEQTADGYVVHVEPPWEDFPGESVEADTERMNREIERWVRRLPDQYLWTHRRFKTRPPGEPSIY